MSKLGEWDNKLLIENFKMLQDKLSQKEKLLDEAIEVIKFYGDKDNWRKQSQTNYTICCINDMEGTAFIKFGGKRARSFLEKMKELK